MEIAVDEVKDKSILIVEDHADLAEVLTTILAIYGMRVSHVQSGAKALKHLEQNITDIILLDMLLPDMDGLDVIASVRQNEKLRYIPIVAVTGSWEKREPCLRRGCDGFLLKPFAAVRLVSQIQLLCSRQSDAAKQSASQ
jgi:CheY-like chemotaxis protein